jgi:D-alanyl-D-alanine dipeptidase
VHGKLQELGYGLLVHDAYRPWHVTKMFWDATPPEKRIYVADPDRGSEHNRYTTHTTHDTRHTHHLSTNASHRTCCENSGCAVDLTLYSRATGDVVEMIGGYDEFSQRSHVNYPGGTSLQR